MGEGKISSTQSLLDAVSPQMTIFNVGYCNLFGHHKADVIEHY